MDFEKGKEVLKEKDVRLVYGRNDPFLTDARVIEMKSLAQKTGVTSTPIIFDGAHEMNEPTLLELIN
jgi:predicted esterase